MNKSLIERLRAVEFFSDGVFPHLTESDRNLIDKMRNERKEAARRLELLENELAVLRLKLVNAKRIANGLPAFISK